MPSEDMTVAAAYGKMFAKVWMEAEKKVEAVLGFHLSVSVLARQQAQRYFAARPDVQKYDPRVESDRRILQREFRITALLAAQTLADDFVKKLTSLDKSTLSKLRRVTSPKSEIGSYQSVTVRIRNIELISFVAQRIIPLTELLSEGGGLKPGRHGPTHAAPWGELREEWNRTHGHRYKSDRSMSRQYYRAVQTSLGKHFVSAIMEALQSKPMRRVLGGCSIQELRRSLFAGLVVGRPGLLPQHAEQFEERARSLRKENESSGLSPATRAENESRAQAYQNSAETLRRVAEVKEWVVIGGSRRQTEGPRRLKLPAPAVEPNV